MVTELQTSSTVKIPDIESDSPAQQPFRIYIYSDVSDVKQVSSNSPPIATVKVNDNPQGNIDEATKSLLRSILKMNCLVPKIRLKKPNETEDQPLIEVAYLDTTISRSEENNSTINSTNPNKPIVPYNIETEEYDAMGNSLAKISISDLKEKGFYDTREF